MSWQQQMPIGGCRIWRREGGIGAGGQLTAYRNGHNAILVYAVSYGVTRSDLPDLLSAHCGQCVLATCCNYVVGNANCEWTMRWR